MKTKTLLAVAAGIILSYERTCANQFSNIDCARAHGADPDIASCCRQPQCARLSTTSIRSGASKIDFAGTALMPGANGQAKVESKKGYIEIEVEFGNLQNPTTFGVCRSFV